MMTKPRRKVWRLDREGKMSPRANGLAWRVVAADRDRIDPAADYMFCGPDFLFQVDSVARALHVEADPRPNPIRKLASR